MEYPDVGKPENLGPEPRGPGLVAQLLGNPMIVVPLGIMIIGIIVALAA
mgnify:CR=1 FL=1